MECSNQIKLNVKTTCYILIGMDHYIFLVYKQKISWISMRGNYVLFLDIVSLMSPVIGWDWWRVQGRGRNMLPRWSSRALLTTCPLMTVAEIYRNLYITCETLLWTAPTSIVPAKMLPITHKDTHALTDYINKGHNWH